MKKKRGVAAALFFVLAMCASMVMIQEKQTMAQTGFSKMDANGNSEITVIEHKEFWKGRFSELDANKDGKLTVDEFMKGFTNRSFHEADVDKDKVLAAQEYVAYWCGPYAKATKGAQGTSQTNLVANGDVNMDGKISKDECLAIWLTRYHNMDSDKDEKVTMNEFTAYIRKMFKDLDKDGDGYIILEEYDYYLSGKASPVKK